MLHGDWRVVLPLRGANLPVKGDPGNLEAKLEHPYRRSSQNGDSVEAPHSAHNWGGACLETAPRTPEAPGTPPHCNVPVTWVPDGFGTSSALILGPQIASKPDLQGAPEGFPDGYDSEVKEN